MPYPMIRPQDRPLRPGKARTYDLEEATLEGPPLPGEVIVARTPDRLIDLTSDDQSQHGSSQCPLQTRQIEH